MKKHISVLTVFTLILILVFCGCSGGETAKDAFILYTDMNAAMKEVTSMEMDSNVKMEMTYGEENLSFDITGTAQQIIQSETDIDMIMEMSMDMTELGLSGMVTIHSYYLDGYMYQDIMGFRSKTKVDIETAMEQSGLNMFEFDSTAIIDSSVADVDGGKELSFKLDGTKLTNMIQPLVESQLSGMGLAGESSVEIGDVSYSVVIGKDSLPLKQLSNIAIKMVVEDETIDMKMDMDIAYTGFNSVESLDFPEDLADYPEGSVPTI